MGLDVAGIGAVADLGSKLLDIGGKVFDRIIPDKAAAQKAKDELAAQFATQEFQLALGQIQINAEEAKSTNWFVAGWRPFVGWTCGVAYAYSFVILPFLEFFAYLWGSPETVKQLAQLPHLDLGAMMPLLLGMLGLGGMRSWEKVKGAEGNR